MTFEEFTAYGPAPEASDREQFHCRFDTLSTAISTRHSDTVDVKFLVNGKGIVIALAHAGFARFRESTGRALTDSEAVQIAGLFLKVLLERGERVEDPILPVSSDETLALARQITRPLPHLRARAAL
jgi:hypothetical protein